MSAHRKPMSLQEFLDWERSQEARYEFDGTRPVPMTGGSRMHARIATRLLVALSQRIQPPAEAFGPDLKVNTAAGARIRYPDASVVLASSDEASDIVEPAAVFEVLSPSTASIDRRVKPAEYATVPTVAVYVLLEQDRPAAGILRRGTGWRLEEVEGITAVIDLPEIGLSLPLAEIYRE